MMRLSNKSVYALRALFDLAFYGESEPVQLKDIAERQCIPSRFLEQIFQTLKRAGLVRSKRGPGGGYLLGRMPSTIRLGDVFRALGEAPQMGDVGLPEQRDRPFVADVVCGELLDSIHDLLDSTTLEDLRRRGVTLGVPRGSYEDFVYVI